MRGHPPSLLSPARLSQLLRIRALARRKLAAMAMVIRLRQSPTVITVTSLKNTTLTRLEKGNREGVTEGRAEVQQVLFCQKKKKSKLRLVAVSMTSRGRRRVSARQRHKHVRRRERDRRVKDEVRYMQERVILLIYYKAHTLLKDML